MGVLEVSRGIALALDIELLPYRNFLINIYTSSGT
jgi:hypothetical protein